MHEADGVSPQAGVSSERGSILSVRGAHHYFPSGRLSSQPFLSVSTSALKGLTWTQHDKPVFKYVHFE